MLELIVIGIVSLCLTILVVVLENKRNDVVFKDVRQSRDNLINIAQEQQKVSERLITFIDKNIKERVIYADPQTGYVNADKFDDQEEKVIDDEFIEPEDMTPEKLEEIMESKQKEEGKE